LTAGATESASSTPTSAEQNVIGGVGPASVSWSPNPRVESSSTSPTSMPTTPPASTPAAAANELQLLRSAERVLTRSAEASRRDRLERVRAMAPVAAATASARAGSAQPTLRALSLTVAMPDEKRMLPRRVPNLVSATEAPEPRRMPKLMVESEQTGVVGGPSESREGQRTLRRTYSAPMGEEARARRRRSKHRGESEPRSRTPSRRPRPQETSLWI
jgi:hypothetical protein